MARRRDARNAAGRARNKENKGLFESSAEASDALRSIIHDDGWNVSKAKAWRNRLDESGLSFADVSEVYKDTYGESVSETIESGGDSFLGLGKGSMFKGNDSERKRDVVFALDAGDGLIKMQRGKVVSTEAEKTRENIARRQEEILGHNQPQTGQPQTGQPQTGQPDSSQPSKPQTSNQPEPTPAPQLPSDNAVRSSVDRDLPYATTPPAEAARNAALEDPNSPTSRAVAHMRNGGVSPEAARNVRESVKDGTYADKIRTVTDPEKRAAYEEIAASIQGMPDPQDVPDTAPAGQATDPNRGTISFEMPSGRDHTIASGTSVARGMEEARAREPALPAQPPSGFSEQPPGGSSPAAPKLYNAEKPRKDRKRKYKRTSR